MSTVATLEQIRAHFPALERAHNGHPVAYFDGPGGTQVPRAVVEAMTEYLYDHNANTHWHYPSSHETDELIADARRAVGDFLNARPDEIAFGANMTTLTFHLARALGRGWGPGDEVVITELDHHANQAPWRAIERERGITIRVAKFHPGRGELDWESLAACITPRTKLVAIGAGSNALGTVTDVSRAADMAHAVGALCFVDAVHYAPHFLVDVRRSRCDFLACSSYKFHGPHIGILYGRHELLASLDVPKLAPAPNEAPDRLETGTQNHEGIIGTMAAIDFLADLAHGDTRRERLQRSYDEIHRRSHSLFAQLWGALGEIDGVTVYGPSVDAPRTSTLAFALKDHKALAVAEFCAARGLFVSHGDFYASTVVDRLGHQPDGLVRIGLACYTAGEEIDRLIRSVQVLAR
ncbi:MAG: cysteine desulfurase-like protein [Gemmatimonadaceae bacterium]|nr:cysteine desulfurase-like protein [Gemmatimonadaceae bacterium]